MNCIVCSANDWRSLPVPTSERSLTTSGIIIPAPLEREQCMSCGLLQIRNQRFLGHGKFYEEQYQNYYGRPNWKQFDRDRYSAMAEWMKSALGNEFAPRTILDVGCGVGRSMDVTHSVYPEAVIEGIEPSIANAEKARQAGFSVLSERFGNGGPLAKPYDLIYANNVLQHVTDVPGFFRDLATNLTATGRAALILPDATNASNEMLWCDHNYSFRPGDLFALAERAGLQVCKWQLNPPNNSLLDKQIVVLGKTSGKPAMKADDLERPLSSAALFEQRSQYMSNWQDLDRELVRRTASYKRVFNFGASMWTWLLAAYCPDYWNSVAACLVDGGSGRCMDKPVVSPGDAGAVAGDCIALGINPKNQAVFQTRLSGLGIDIIGWSDRIDS